MNSILTPHQARWLAWELTRQRPADSVEGLAATLADSKVDLNPHQIDAAIFACKNPFSKGVLLADEVGLGKTIEAGLVIAQRIAERKNHILVLVPANLRKQWYQELRDKFGIQARIVDSKTHGQARKLGQNPWAGVVITSYGFAHGKASDIKAESWDMAVLDEAHRLRNVYKTGNVTARALKKALLHVPHKVLLTATPLQNTLLELYGLVSFIDDHVFGDPESFKLGYSNDLPRLRERLRPLCQRTLRRDVLPYIAYTARLPMVETFTPFAEEQQLAALVADYLRRPKLQALTERQRPLVSLLLWKFLASSSHAIAGSLLTMADRLEKTLRGEALQGIEINTVLEEEPSPYEDEEGFDDESSASELRQTAQDRQELQAEIAELRQFHDLASGIRHNAKADALLRALEKAFDELARLGAAKKAIIFTESRRTQDYLAGWLKQNGYGEGLVLFNGSNSSPEATKIHQQWLKKHKNSDHISGSKSADTRAALVEYFRDHGQILIATEAGAEGINLQFCSLVINYDLPWNPQRIEQRIGRCHRYGQKHDVVVVNFVDLSNPADQRVYELLAEKFQLFQGVFGASDEVLGAIESGVDIEKRIAALFRECRSPAQIQAGFDHLQQHLAEEIRQQMASTQQKLLEHFDEDVQARLKVCADQSQRAISQHEQKLLALTAHELAAHARFDANGFVLHQSPLAAHSELGQFLLPLGRYELPRRSEHSHAYRLGEPLAEWVTTQAKTRALPVGTLHFNYAAHKSRLSSLEGYRGQSGQLQVSLLTVTGVGQAEQHLLISAITDSGELLPENDPEKLLRLPAEFVAGSLPALPDPSLEQALEQNQQQRHSQLAQASQQRHSHYFLQELQKLDAWADDQKAQLEQALKAQDQAIKEAERDSKTAADLALKLAALKHVAALKEARKKARQRLYEQQDDIDQERNSLIDGLEQQLQQRSAVEVLFRVGWVLV